MRPDHEQRALFESTTLRIEEYRCYRAETEHEEEYALAHEIVFPRAGTFLRHDTTGTAVADVNHVLFFQHGQPYKVSHPIPGGDRSLLINLENTVLLDVMRDSNPHVDERLDRPFPLGHLLVTSEQRLWQYWLLHSIAASDTLAIEELALLLVGEILRHAYEITGARTNSARPATANAHHEIGDAVKLLLAERFSEKLHLAEIAAAVHTSPYHLCRIFKNHSGLSIHAYLRRTRLLHALERIADKPGIPLTLLALELGFASHSHFSTAFQSEFGLPPSALRRGMNGRRFHEMRKNLKVS